MKDNTIITISRQYGSGGRELSSILAKKLGVKLYDRQIINLAAEQLGIQDMDFEKMKKLEEAIPPLSLKFMPFYVFGMNGAKPINNKMFEAESKIVKQLAEDGSCIILGRCADHILKGKQEVYSFYICANDEYREKRGHEIYEGKTLYELNEEDGKRGQYYQYYTGNKWGDPTNYNLIINTSDISLEQAADLIINYIELRQKNNVKK